MLKRLRQPMLWVLVVFLVGQLVARILSRGNEASDDFRIAAVFGGKKFRSQAAHLHSGAVITSMGGIDLDLSDASLDPAGARIDVKAMMGGVKVTVPDDWAVRIDKSALAGGVEAKTTAPEDLSADAPRLDVHAVVLMGGVLVTTRDQRVADARP